LLACSKQPRCDCVDAVSTATKPRSFRRITASGPPFCDLKQQRCQHQHIYGAGVGGCCVPLVDVQTPTLVAPPPAAASAESWQGEPRVQCQRRPPQEAATAACRPDQRARPYEAGCSHCRPVYPQWHPAISRRTSAHTGENHWLHECQNCQQCSWLPDRVPCLTA
jgi:hypothetical protein